MKHAGNSQTYIYNMVSFDKKSRQAKNESFFVANTKCVYESLASIFCGFLVGFENCNDGKTMQHDIKQKKTLIG